ncbi:MAG: acyl-CoA dehydrogenase family protein, partial [Actinomycetes bacterium]
MDLSLTEEQAALRELARDFIDREVVPHTRDWDRAEQVDRGIVGKLAEVGFLGMTIPEQYGGSGGSFLDATLFLEETARGRIPVSAYG